MSDVQDYTSIHNDADIAWGNFSLKAKLSLAASFLAAILMVAMVVGVSFWAFRQIEVATETRKHISTLITQTDALMSELRDAESGQRGYLLTGDNAFLNSYLAVNDNIKGNLEELRQLNFIPAAQKYLDKLPPLVNAKLAELAQTIELRRNHNMDAALEIVAGGQGKLLMDSLRTEVSGFIHVLQVSQEQNNVELQSNMHNLFAIIVTASLFTLLFGIWFVLLIYREARQRLKNLVHVETLRALEIQEELTRQLELANTILLINEERLTVTLNSIGDAVLTTDTEARVTLLNPIAEQLTGWTSAEARGRPVGEIFHIINKETRLPGKIPVMETLTNGVIIGLANHTVLIARNGSECDIADSCAPIRDNTGEVAGAVLVFRNVTAEYAVQQALIEREAVELYLANDSHRWMGT
jgi:PAS domain S-box-containing protein